MTRIDDDQLHASLEGFDDGRGVGQARVRGIVTPQDQAPSCAEMSGMAPPALPVPTLPTP